MTNNNATVVSIAMEGYNGWARPLDSLIMQKGYQLYNVNNVKLARFKEIFPAAAKTDKIDARKIVELFTLQKHLPMAKGVLQEVYPSEEINAQLKRLTRRRKQLVEEKVALMSRFFSDLSAYLPDLRAITTAVDNLWFLRFFTLRKDVRQLANVRAKTILNINYLTHKHLTLIQSWQKKASFVDAIDDVAPMLYDDAMRILTLKEKINSLTKTIATLIPQSSIAKRIESIPGFATISAGELAGEIGTLQRFSSEASLALYLGMTNLDNSSGKITSSKRNMATNRHAKMAMITATMKHTQHVIESKRYLEKKIGEGKKYQQAIRSIGRHLVRVIWNLIKQDRNYVVKNI
jgi:transposase